MRRLLLAGALALGLTGCGGSAVSAEAADPLTCEGYPEPRVYLASQSGWDDGELATYGEAEHVHAETCFPFEQVVSGVVRLDVVAKLHNEQGRSIKRVRVHAAADGRSTVNFEVQPSGLRCDVADCTFIVPLDVDTDRLAAGRWEWRVAVETYDGTSSLNNRNLATSGWPVAVRSTAGVTPANDRYEARGWYRDATGAVRGYINGRFGWLAEHDAEFPWINGAYVPVSGQWCPPLRILAGAQEGGTEPLERSAVYVDPDFHHGSSGIVLRDQAGPLQERVCIDTTTLTNGRHKLMIQGYTSSVFTGQLWGGFVVPFEVAN